MNTLDTFAQLWIAGLVNSVASVTFVALLAWTLARVVANDRPKVRFAIWFGALLTVGFASLSSLWMSRIANVYATESPLTLAHSWGKALFYIWTGGAVVFLFRIAIGFYQIVRLRRNSSLVDLACMAPQVRATIENLSRGSTAQVRVSGRIQVPAAIGFFRPVVLLPSWALTQLSSEELCSVLVHEFEHLRRRDEWSNLAQKIFGALFFFHPAVWWIERNLALEREMVCDEAVVAQTKNAKAYAACLVSLAEKSYVRRSLALAQAAVSRLHQTTIRVTQILRSSSGVTKRKWRPAMFAVSALSASALAGIAMAPPLVSFQRETQAVSIANASVVSPVVLASYIPQPKKQESHAVTARAKSVSGPKELKHAPQAGLALAELDIQNALMLPQAKTQKPPTGQTVLVVLHTEQYDRFGGAMWTISVWRLDLPAQNAVSQKAIPAKQI